MDIVRFNLNPIPFTILVQQIIFVVGLSYLWLIVAPSRARSSLIGFTVCYGTALVCTFAASTLAGMMNFFIPWMDFWLILAVTFALYFNFSVPAWDQPERLRRVLPWHLGIAGFGFIYAVANSVLWFTVDSFQPPHTTLPRLTVLIALTINLFVTYGRFQHFAELPQPSGWSRATASLKLLFTPNTPAVSIQRDLIFYTLFGLSLFSISLLKDRSTVDSFTSAYIQSTMLLLGAGWLATIALKIFDGGVIVRLTAASLFAILTFFNLVGIRQVQVNDRIFTEFSELRAQLQDLYAQDGPGEPDALNVPRNVLYITLWPRSESGVLSSADVQWIFVDPSQSVPSHEALAQMWLSLPQLSEFLPTTHFLQLNMPMTTALAAPGSTLTDRQTDPGLETTLDVEREIIATERGWIEIGRRADWRIRAGDRVMVSLLVPILVMSLLLVLLLPIYFRRGYMQPLQNLMDGVGQANDGKLDISIPVQRMDEIGYLTSSFNSMIKSIRQAQSHMQETNVRLEETVAKRTAQLQAALKDAEAARSAAEASAQEAESANQAKSRFLASVSHDLRTPLHTILGYSELLMRDPGVNPTQHEQLAIVERNSNHLLSLINNILNISKMESGRMRVERHPTDLRGLLDNLTATFRPRIQAKDLTWHTRVGTQVPSFLLLDQDKIRQVLINLIDNGVKFTERGGISVEIDVHIWDVPNMEDPILLTFQVRDTGSGIPARDLDKIFEAFQQAEGPGRGIPGTGLGLTISREFVTLMGGILTVKSTVGQGSTFRFSLNTSETTPTLGGYGDKDSSWLTLAAENMPPPVRVLVVEDFEANRTLLVTILKEMGVAVKAATDGQAGVDLWQRWQPDLILMDLRMPLMDGWAAVRAIRAQEIHRHTTIIALTAGTLNDESQRVLEAGFDGFLAKPYRRQQIVDTLEQFLGTGFDNPRLKKDATIVAETVPVRAAVDRPKRAAGAADPGVLIHDMRNHLSVVFGAIDNLTNLFPSPAEGRQASPLSDQDHKLGLPAGDAAQIATFMALMEERVIALSSQLERLAQSLKDAKTSP